ncbi:GSCOCG00007503001-RA-CDS [Cotesia congregata]|uniref:Similar to COMMD7: COMM domain-containing protein 7 (Bos taurus) n=1 Tax=Cotesia congregata TaxID=51543 RepID=A0A8J2HPI2_COTCN|nr:GSCOCG00007503001-RA-CDS [Cotesia congregata]CAG5101568.1 Similar to COMMD7: COMM domain-containing protein 7 (Bos taurus) [Cotesia congregata]
MEEQKNTLVDVSWKFGVTTSSSESDKVGKTFLQLKLQLNNEGKMKDVFTEMTLTQFYKFIHDLEQAKNNLELLS